MEVSKTDGMRDERNYSLLAHNTFGIDTCCQRFLEYSNKEECKAVTSMLRDEQLPFLIIGAGSNLLLTQDYPGIVVHSAIKGITLYDSPLTSHYSLLTCGSGENWDDVVAWTVGLGFGDLVNLSLIPGDVGASAVQNIGAYGAEVCQFIREIKAIEIATGNEVVITCEECHYDYRESRFKHEWKNRYLITHVTYELHRDSKLNIAYGNIRTELDRQGIDAPTPQQLRDTIIGIRRAKLPEPSELGNAGSFFMNPIVSKEKYEELAAQYIQMPHYTITRSKEEGERSLELEKIPAGWLIDQCGWKGRDMGRAGVHDKQALVLVNRGGATGKDIVALCRAIQEDVRKTFGIELTPEVNIV